ncbi:hypothetical protein [Streptomyces litchfieldiae]|uniref:DUF3618 domain-containing protein n=1 Tax=Streptomyces litchfieldiae TaxID=3075543 RepID=A0ABU2MPD2_9ACTN|nr:hypothetical protein [Streptomyces sp. DSM 44938]MDT0343475.1 hypothetical protein [Streptomyces sp. DSM 44938]
MSESPNADTQHAGRPGEGSQGFAGTAREQGRSMAYQARDQARTTAHDLRGRVADEADSQTHRTAGTVRQWADDLAGLAHNAPGDSPARTLVAQAAEGGHQAADYIDQHGFGGLIDEVQDFARRRPAAFLGGAALAGLAVGRMVKAGRAGSGGARPDEPEGGSAWR